MIQGTDITGGYREPLMKRVRVLRLLTILSTVIIVTGCGVKSIPATSEVSGVIIEEYPTYREQPLLATYADGNYYLLDGIIEVDNYDFYHAKHLPDREFLFTTKHGEIVDIDAEKEWLVWGEYFKGTNRVVIKAYNTNSKDTKELKVMKGEDVRQFPFVSITNEQVFFVECMRENERIVIWRYDLSTGRLEQSKSFDSYETYKPVIEDHNGVIFTPIGVEDGHVKLLELDVSTGEENTVLLPKEIEVLYGMDYDEESKLYVFYYKNSESGDEEISVLEKSKEQLECIGKISSSQRMERDKIAFWKGNVVWIEFNFPKKELPDLFCERKLRLFNLKQHTMHTFHEGRVLEFFYDDENIYCVTVSEDRGRKLYQIDATEMVK